MPIPTKQARATALDPARVNFHPALMAEAWCALKAASGHPVARPELLHPAHLIAATPAPAPPTGGNAGVEAAMARIRDKIRAGIAAGIYTRTGGDAA